MNFEVNTSQEHQLTVTQQVPTSIQVNYYDK